MDASQYKDDLLFILFIKYVMRGSRQVDLPASERTSRVRARELAVRLARQSEAGPRHLASDSIRYGRCAPRMVRLWRLKCT